MTTTTHYTIPYRPVTVSCDTITYHFVIDSFASLTLFFFFEDEDDDRYEAGDTAFSNAFEEGEL